MMVLRVWVNKQDDKLRSLKIGIQSFIVMYAFPMLISNLVKETLKVL